MQFSKSNKLANVCYDIRGPVLKHAKRLEEEGHRILKLNMVTPRPLVLRRRRNPPGHDPQPAHRPRI
jgi:hypothetical protein